MSTLRPGRCGGRNARRRPTPTASTVRWTRTGTGRTPALARAGKTGRVSHGLRRRAATHDRVCIHDRGDARRTGSPAPHAAGDRLCSYAGEHPPNRTADLREAGRGCWQSAVRRNGTRLDASVRVLVQRPQQPRVARPDSRVGVDVGVRRLATVADERRHSASNRCRIHDRSRRLCEELRHVSRARSRCTKGSRRYRERTTEMSRLHRRVNDVRTHHLHVLTTRLAKTHGRIVVEGLDAAGMLRQKGLPGARARRRGLVRCRAGHAAPAPVLQDALVRVGRWWSLTAGFRRRKPVTVAGMCRTSAGSNTGNATRVRLSISGMTTPLIEPRTLRGTTQSSVVGPVGAAVKRGADHKTGPGRAGGCEARKGRSHKAAEQPRDGVKVTARGRREIPDRRTR